MLLNHTLKLQPAQSISMQPNEKYFNAFLPLLEAYFNAIPPQISINLHPEKLLYVY